MAISDFLAGFIPAIGVVIWLPTETPILLGIFIIFCVVVAMDVVHFKHIEKPYVRDWLHTQLRKEADSKKEA
jgi:hypothetical protein